MSNFDDEDIKDIKPGPIAFLAAHPVAANLLMIICLVGGFIILSQAKQEVFPEFQLDIVTTTMSYPGASPEEVEQGILLAIEDAIKDVDGLGEVTAAAFEGYGHVMAEIDNEDESIRIAQDVKTAVDQITTFPVDAENLTVSLTKRERHVMRLVLHGDVSNLVLRDTAETVRNRLEQHKDISLVSFSNAKKYETHIEISQDVLRRYNLSIPEIAEIVRRTSLELGGGSLKTAAGEILVRMSERRNYAREFRDIPIVKNTNGSTIYLGDIATITDGFEDKNKFEHYNGNPAIEIQVSSTADQTPIGISVATRAVVDDINQRLPGDLKLTITEDRSKVFQQRAELLIKNGLVGLFLVVIFLALFLDVRLAFWVSMGIPISYMGAFLLLPAADYFSINMVSMFAFIIALGIVVDDAIVVGENIYHNREKGYKPLQASVLGAREMSIPVFVSVLTNIVAFMPMLFMPGYMGKIFSIIPVVVISTFILSLIESLFILPAHLTFKQAKTIKSRPLKIVIAFQKAFNKRFDSFIETKYLPFVKRVVYLRYISLACFMAVLIIMGSFVAGGHLGIQMFPRVESDFSYAKAVMKVGTPEAEVLSLAKRLVTSSKQIIADNGGDTLSFGVYSKVNENEIEVFSFLADPDIRPISTKEFTDLWRAQTGDVHGLESLVFASNHGGPGSGAALTVELSHNDTDILDKAAVALAEHLTQFPNAQDIDDGAAQGKRQFNFTMTDLGYTLGLTPADVGRQVRSSFYGAEALKQQRGRNEVRVLVMLEEEERESAYHFQNLMIKTPSGSNVMLRDVVKVDEGRAYTTINRRNNSRVITVSADVDPPSESNLIISSITADILPKLQNRYPGLTYSFEGQQADMRESLNSLFIGMFGILFIMYALLAVLFSSYSQPLMVMIAIPFSMVGAIIGHFVMGYPMSIVSMFGIIALSGVVINDSLILIDLANKKRKEGMDSYTAVVTSARYRFRAIVLTTLTTFLGLAPMMFETSRQAKFLIPMAVSLGYGILFATLLTLLLIPCLYMINEDFRRLINKIRGKPHR